MKVAEVMTRDVSVIEPHRSVRDAARLMDEMNVGVLPVCDGRRLLGMITDRDIVVRSTATGAPPDRHHVDEIMSRSLQWCFEDDDAHEVLMHMSEKQIRRMPVVDDDRRLVGIVTLGDLATDHAQGVEEALRRISTPSEPDRSGTLTSARADRARDRSGSHLTEEEQRELARRRDAPGPDRFRRSAPDIGPPRGDLQDFPENYRRYGSRGLRDEDLRRAEHGSGEGWRQDVDRGFRFREEDDRRATFAGGFNEGYGEGEGEGPGRMRGGFGGGGYSNYGRIYGRGAQGGGAGGPGYFGDYGSYRDGTPRLRGSEGEENYDRGMRSGREHGPSLGGTRFSNETAEDYRAEGSRHRGRGPKGYVRSDDRISEDVCERLMEDRDVDATEIDVSVSNSEVTLSGTVASREAKRRAEDCAERIPGVTHVQNNLRVSQGTSGGTAASIGIGSTTGAAGTGMAAGAGGVTTSTSRPKTDTAV
jgi:CBS domain-containing protein